MLCYAMLFLMLQARRLRYPTQPGIHLMPFPLLALLVAKNPRYALLSPFACHVELRPSTFTFPALGPAPGHARLHR